MSITKRDNPQRILLRGSSLKLIFTAAIYFLALRLAPAVFASSTVVINEFSSQTSPDWVELYNTSDAQVNLGNYILTDNSTSGNPKSVSCFLAPHGFSTIDWSNKLNNNGDTIFLKLGNETLDCISFGNGDNGSCPGESGATLANPSADQVGARMPDGGTWQLTTGSTKDSPNDGSSKSADAVCSTPTPTPSPTPTPTSTPTPKPTSTPKPATATPVPTNTSTPTLTPTSTLTFTNDNLPPQVLAEADENPQPEVNLEIIDLTATAESEINPSLAPPPKSGPRTSPIFIISAAGAALMFAGGIPLIWSEFKFRRKIK